MIKIHNDGKCKLYSYEASLVLDGVEAVGYGDSEEEAIMYLRQEVELIKSRLQNVDYETKLYVDWAGKEL